ncbi:unnamed protein product [Prorocentrum cordatum]|uniref:Uncharacterized protein n=2 Tax=Prorocentrum cordatum TaxID=2364126 RepID=A0ABN9T1G9_9DINO|nr:unnamed protein product [Polarella glacialis]
MGLTGHMARPPNQMHIPPCLVPISRSRSVASAAATGKLPRGWFQKARAGSAAPSRRMQSTLTVCPEEWCADAVRAGARMNASGGVALEALLQGGAPEAADAAAPLLRARALGGSRPGRLPVWAVGLICLAQGILLYVFIVWRNIKQRVAVKQELREHKPENAKD